MVNLATGYLKTSLTSRFQQRTMAAARKVNSAQWKKFQPPTIQDSAILSFYQNSSDPSSIRRITPATTVQTANSDIREKGFIDKCQHSYGFIQCCDKDTRYFFHFSEYRGCLELINVGEPVDFCTSEDQHSGKPIAVDVSPIDITQATPSTLTDDAFVGTVIQEACSAAIRNGSVTGNRDSFGRVSYEQNGECFFIPFTQDSVVDSSVKLRTGDQVMFRLSANSVAGIIEASNIELIVLRGKRYLGVICSMKESFGFIERGDVVGEIFFHFTEYRGNIDQLSVGDDVEFSIQMWNSKDVATEIEKLPDCSVIFEDISTEKTRGHVLKVLKTDSNWRSGGGARLGGAVFYEQDGAGCEVPYRDRDRRGTCTLLAGDVVSFNIATDRRDKLQRATNVELLEESFEADARETGSVSSAKNGYGFIQCADREGSLFFNCFEFIDLDHVIEEKDDVEFSVQHDITGNRSVATRIKALPKGSVSFMTMLAGLFVGTIQREPITCRGRNKDTGTGVITFDLHSKIHTASYCMKDVADTETPPHYGDKVTFEAGHSKLTNMLVAVKVRVALRSTTSRCQGYIASLKENYGFIENDNHDQDVFFHFSAFSGDAISELDLGDEVQYTLTKRSSRVSAEEIKKLPSGSVGPGEEIVKSRGVVVGRVVRPMRIVDPSQADYCGLVQVGTNSEDSEAAEMYPYGITSLTDKRDFLQKGDIVKFQLAAVKGVMTLRAVNLAAQRKYVRAKVDSVMGQYGFLDYEAKEGRKLFFHMTEVHDSSCLLPGDEAEFVVVRNQRNGKYSACSLRILGERKQRSRPERLSLLKINSESRSAGPVVERQPLGPDSTKGFTLPRIPWRQHSPRSVNG